MIFSHVTFLSSPKHLTLQTFFFRKKEKNKNKPNNKKPKPHDATPQNTPTEQHTKITPKEPHAVTTKIRRMAALSTTEQTDF